MTHPFPTLRSSDLDDPQGERDPLQELLVLGPPGPEVDEDDAQAVEGVQADRGDERDLAEAHDGVLVRADDRVVRLGAHSHECGVERSEEHTSELQSLMRISYAAFGLKKKKQ